MRRPSGPVFIALGAGLLAVAVSALIALYSMGGMRHDPQTFASIAPTGPQFQVGGSFDLVRAGGERVTEGDFPGQHLLIFFGFTHCPDVCPTELMIMASALDTLAESDPALAEKVQPIFITIDPERDTPELMAEYVANFHPRMIGLSGSVDAVAKAAREFRVYYAKAPIEGADDYLMDHSSFVYLMNPDGDLAALFRPNSDPADAARALQAIVGRHG